MTVLPGLGKMFPHMASIFPGPQPSQGAGLPWGHPTPSHRCCQDPVAVLLSHAGCTDQGVSLPGRSREGFSLSSLKSK